MLSRSLLLAPILFSLTACGADATEDAPGTATQALDCAWIASDNCWRRAARAIAEHIPETSGTLDADRRVCDYASSQVVFDDPVLPFSTDEIALSIMAGSSEVARVERGMGAMHIETAAGMVDVHAVANGSGYGITVTCDGEGYTTDDFIGTMQACEPDPSDWPGTVVEQTSTNLVGMDLAGGDGGQVRVFSCAY